MPYRTRSISKQLQLQQDITAAAAAAASVIAAVAAAAAAVSAAFYKERAADAAAAERAAKMAELANTPLACHGHSSYLHDKK